MRSLFKPEYLYRPSQLVKRCAREIRGTPGGAVTAGLPWGAKLQIEPAADAIGRAIWHLGLHDLLVCEALWRLTGPGDLAVDGGANLGQMTTLLRRRVTASGKVVAFEPHPEVCEKLERNTQMQAGRRGVGPVEVRRLALDASAGERSFLEGDEFSGNQGTARLVRSGKTAFSVRTETLDALFPSETIAVLKLDLEGGEGAALAGAHDLLSGGRIRHIVFESEGDGLSRLTARLEERSYTCWRLRQRLRGPVLTPVEAGGGLAYAAPSFLASRSPDEAIRRFAGWGWRCLSCRERE